MAMRYPGRGQQRGAVALIVGLLSVLVLFGMMGIAVDLAYLYARKTELQNAADAAALSGAKELNQTPGGVTAAVNAAIATFGANATANLVDGETISINNIRLGPCPNPDDRLPLRTPSCTFVDASSVDSGEEAAPLSFLEVDTGVASTKPVFFMPVIGGQDNAAASGYAVAGHYFNQITPIGVCAVSLTKYNRYAHGEVLEYGFRRGMSYNVMELGPLGSNNLPYLINPVDTDPATCNPAHSSANFTAPFVCMGTSAVGPTTSGFSAIGNTGLSDSILRALNSRFGLYGGSSGGSLGSNQCDPSSAPPDSNVMQYCYKTSLCSNQAPKMDANAYGLDPNNLANWNRVEPSYQTVQLDPVTKKPRYNLPSAVNGNPGLAFVTPPSVVPSPKDGGPQNGVLWSYGPAFKATIDGNDPPNATGVGSAFTASEANALPQMYNNGTLMSYFGGPYPSGASIYPYTDPSFRSAPTYPPGATGVANRRIINILIVNCDAPLGNGACGQVLDVKGIGRFFMQRLSDPTGNPKHIDVEFAGLIDPVASAEIKLYR